MVMIHDQVRQDRAQKERFHDPFVGVDVSEDLVTPELRGNKTVSGDYGRR